MPSLETIKEDSGGDVNPWKLFKSSEIILAVQLVQKITSTLFKYSSIDLNSISDGDKIILLMLSDNTVPYEWRKMWQGPKLASEFLKSVATRVQTVTEYLNELDQAIHEIDFSKIFKVDSFLSTVKLVTSRELKVSTSDLVIESFTDPSRHDKMKFDQVFFITIAPLLIDGLSFDKNRLVQADGASPLNYTSSIFLFFKENIAANLHGDEPGTFAIPLYATHSREKLLCTIRLNSSLERNEIVFSGTSLIVPGN